MKFRKKPVVIEAVRWRGDNWEEVKSFCPEARRKLHGIIIIPTLEGDHSANHDDWIIRGVKGEFYPCKPDIFAMTYEPVDLFEPDEPAKQMASPGVTVNDVERMIWMRMHLHDVATHGNGFIRLRAGSQDSVTTALIAKKYITSVTVYVVDTDRLHNRKGHCVVVKTMEAGALYYGPRVFDTEEEALTFAKECVAP